MQTLALFFLVAVAIGGVAWVFVYPLLSGERKAEKRTADGGARRAGRARQLGARTRRSRAASRSKETLKELEAAPNKTEDRCRFRCASRRPA